MSVHKRGDKFVTLTRSGRVLGTHPTRAKANAQLAAVEADKKRRRKLKGNL